MINYRFFLSLVNCLTVMVTLEAAIARADAVFSDNFDGPDAPLIGHNAQLGGNWAQTGSNTSNPIQTTAGAVKLQGIGQDAYAPLSSQVAAAGGFDLKTSLDLNVAAAQADGDYFFHLSDPAGTATNFYQRVMVKSAASGTGYVLGLTDPTNPFITWGSAEISYNSSHRVDVVWHFVPGGNTNDVFSLSVDGNSYLTHNWSSTVAEPAQISAINFRQGNSTSTVPTLSVDNLTVSTVERYVPAFNINEWEYVDPANRALGKKPSAVRAYDGFGLQGGPGLYATALKLNKAYLAGANLNGANFTSADLTDAELSGADLTNARLENGVYARTNLQQANLSGARMSGTFTRANLSQANLTNADLRGANLTGASLGQAILTGANVTGANLGSTHITLDQLYSTASYLNHDLTGTQFVGHDLSSANLAGQNLTSTNFYAAKLVGASFANANLNYAEFVNADLTQANFTGANFTSGSVALANLSGANLRNANLAGANFIGTNLAGAEIRGANLSPIQYITYENQFESYVCGPKHNGAPCSFSKPILIWGFPTPVVQTVGTGITLGQLVSTASYAARDLSGVTLTNSFFNGADFAGFNLTISNFSGTRLDGANFSGADARGAAGLSSVTAANFIRADGHIAGLTLAAGQTLAVRDYDAPPVGTAIPIRVDQQLSLATGSTLQLIFDADPWDSTISFAAGIPVTLAGSLHLALAPGVDPSSQVGRTFDLFDWTGVTRSGTFAINSPYLWDVSQLYTTGNVTFLAVNGFGASAPLSPAIPEPSSALLCLLLSAFCCIYIRFVRTHG